MVEDIFFIGGMLFFTFFGMILEDKTKFIKKWERYLDNKIRELK